MSRSNYTPSPNLKQELPAGIHLSVVSEFDKQGDKYVIGFQNHLSKTHQEVIEAEKYVFKFLKQLGILPGAPILKSDIINKRIWIFLKQDGDKVKLFNTEPYINEKKPYHPEDPELTGGVLIGDFTTKQPELNNELPEF